jgi:hypothetical protein
VVAWQDNSSGNYEIYVKKWNGSSWVDIGAGSSSSGGISNSAGDAALPSIVLDSSNNPYVVWYDDNIGWPNYEVYVKHWDGGAWVELNGSATGGGISNNSGHSYYAVMALDTSNKPVVAWMDDTNGNWEIYIKRWNGSAWVEIGTGSASGGGISNNNGSSEEPALALDSSGNPVVAWDDNTSGDYEIYLKRWQP